jgi:hypothetical protein
MAEEKLNKVCSPDLKDSQEEKDMFIRIVNNYLARYEVDNSFDETKKGYDN